MDLPTRKKRGGRPPRRKVQPGDRVPLSLRVSPEIKQNIDHASEVSGRSQSQEVEFRIEHSFTRENLLNDALALRHGPQGAAVLMAVSDALRLVTMFAGGALIDEGGEWSLDDCWLDDARCYEAAAKAITLVLRGLHPTNPVATGWKGPFRRQHLWIDTPVFAAAAALKNADAEHRYLLPGKRRSK
jgi:hypothetical protein